MVIDLPPVRYGAAADRQVLTKGLRHPAIDLSESHALRVEEMAPATNQISNPHRSVSLPRTVQLPRGFLPEGFLLDACPTKLD